MAARRIFFKLIGDFRANVVGGAGDAAKFRGANTNSVGITAGYPFFFSVNLVAINAVAGRPA